MGLYKAFPTPAFPAISPQPHHCAWNVLFFFVSEPVLFSSSTSKPFHSLLWNCHWQQAISPPSSLSNNCSLPLCVLLVFPWRSPSPHCSLVACVLSHPINSRVRRLRRCHCTLLPSLWHRPLVEYILFLSWLLSPMTSWLLHSPKTVAPAPSLLLVLESCSYSGEFSKHVEHPPNTMASLVPGSFHLRQSFPLSTINFHSHTLKLLVIPQTAPPPKLTNSSHNSLSLQLASSTKSTGSSLQPQQGPPGHW